MHQWGLKDIKYNKIKKTVKPVKAEYVWEFQDFRQCIYSIYPWGSETLQNQKKESFKRHFVYMHYNKYNSTEPDSLSQSVE